MTDSFDVCRSKLVATVDRLIAQSGNSTNFDAESWVDQWVTELLPALGATPRDYVLAGNDCELLVKLMLQAQSSSFG